MSEGLLDTAGGGGALPEGAVTHESIILDPVEVADRRIELDLTPFLSAQGVDWGEAKIEAVLAQIERGELPADYRIENRELTAPLVLRDREGFDFEQIREWLQAKVALWHQEQGWLKRTLSNGAVLFADIADATLGFSNDWLAAYRALDVDAVLKLSLVPDFYGYEEPYDAMSGTGLVAGLLLKQGATAMVKGNYPARCRFVIDEDDGVAKRGALLGMRSRSYDSAATAALTYEAADLDMVDQAYVGDAGLGVDFAIIDQLSATWAPVVGADLTHEGVYRVWCRGRSRLTDDVQLRLVWGDMLNPTANRLWQFPTKDADYLADLGVVRISKPPMGEHRWQLQVQTRDGRGANGATLVQTLEFQPLSEVACKVTSEPELTTAVQILDVLDEYDHSAGDLDGEIMTRGGTWAVVAGSDTADFVQLGDPYNWVVRTAVGDSMGGRWLDAGVANYPGSQVVEEDSAISVNTAVFDLDRHGVYARRSGAGYVYGEVYPMTGYPFEPSGTGQAVLGVEHGGAEIVTRTIPYVAGQLMTKRLLVGEGFAMLWVFPAGSSPGEPLVIYHDELLTGGDLETGKVGKYEEWISVDAVRVYTRFASWPAELDALVHPNRSAEFRTDGTFREVAGGTYWGRTEPAIGKLLRVPVAGLEDRPVELYARLSRGDLKNMADGDLDAFTITPHIAPSWLTLPEA